MLHSVQFQYLLLTLPHIRRDHCLLQAGWNISNQDSTLISSCPQPPSRLLCLSIHYQRRLKRQDDTLKIFKSTDTASIRSISAPKLINKYVRFVNCEYCTSPSKTKPLDSSCWVLRKEQASTARMKYYQEPCLSVQKQYMFHPRNLSHLERTTPNYLATLLCP